MIGAPIFDAVTVDVDGTPLRIEKNAGPLSEVYLNGAKVSAYTFSHADVAGGLTIEFGSHTP